MATREKKPALSRKQGASPLPSKEIDATIITTVAVIETVPERDLEQPGDGDDAATKRKKRNQPALKKPQFKPVNKARQIRLAKKILTQAIVEPAELIKNGIKPKRRRRLNAKNKEPPAPVEEENIDEIKVLEPAIVSPVKKPRKKRLNAASGSSSSNTLESYFSKKEKSIKESIKKSLEGREKAADSKPKAEYTKGKLSEAKQEVASSEKVSEETLEEILNDVSKILDQDEKKEPPAPAVASRLTPVEKERKAASSTSEKVDDQALDDFLDEVAEHLQHDNSEEGKKVLNVVKVARTKAANRRAAAGDILPRKPKKVKLEAFSDDDEASSKLINTLDLNVKKLPSNKLINRRRHSIEKIPGSSGEMLPNLLALMPRSGSPRGRGRGRKSAEGLRRGSPYTTRSDSPARILRNGKHRKLKNLHLLDGVQSRKRKRLCSELSDSQKNSGYQSETDSSLSDMVPSQENGLSDAASDTSSTTVHVSASDTSSTAMPSSTPPPVIPINPQQLRKEIIESFRRLTSPGREHNDLNVNIKSISTKISAILKRSLSMDNAEKLLKEVAKPEKSSSKLEGSFTDTNSNLCSGEDVKQVLPMEVKIENDIKEVVSEIIKGEVVKDIKEKMAESPKKSRTKSVEEDHMEPISSPSAKVPEKSFILDKMKETFNDPVSEDSIKKCKETVKKELKLDDVDSVNEELVKEEPKNKTEQDLKEIESKSELEKNEPENKEKQCEDETEKKSDSNAMQLKEKPDSEVAELEKPLESSIEHLEEIMESESMQIEKVIESLADQIEDESESKIKQAEKTTNSEIEQIEERLESIVEKEKLEFPVPVKNEIGGSDKKDLDVPVKSELVEEVGKVDEPPVILDIPKIKLERKMSIMGDNVFYGQNDQSTENLQPIPITKTDAEPLEDTKATEACLENALSSSTEMMDLHISQDTDEMKNSESEDPYIALLENNSALTITRQSSTPNKTRAVADCKISAADEEEIITQEKVCEEELQAQTDPANSIDTLLSNNLSGSATVEIVETPENQLKKENILNALGLRSLKIPPELEKQRSKGALSIESKLTDRPSKGAPGKADSPPAKGQEGTGSRVENYTGTLKAVIKISRSSSDKSKKKLKMTFHKSKGRSNGHRDTETEISGAEASSRSDVGKEGGTGHNSRGSGSQSSDTAGANRKSHYSNRSNLDVSSEQVSDVDTAAVDGELAAASTTTTAAAAAKALVIPEKASSFSIHPGRLCRDECSYCYGKFGLFDTPCHIAQIKSVERQNRILDIEKHLTQDSCLCDACFRHVDRKSNTTSLMPKQKYDNYLPTRANNCMVQECTNSSSHQLKRKSIIKMKKAICKLINIDLENANLHMYNICSDHYAAIEHLMVCSLCKRKLIKNQTYHLGPEYSKLNNALKGEGIPVTLLDKPAVCKLCKYFCSLLLKPHNYNQDSFFSKYKRRVLQQNGIESPEEPEGEEEPEEKEKTETKDQSKKQQPAGKKTKSIKTKSSQDSDKTTASEEAAEILQLEGQASKQSKSRAPSTDGGDRTSSPSESLIDYELLAPSLTLEYGSDAEQVLPTAKREAVTIKPVIKYNVPMNREPPSKKTSKLVEQLETNPSISVRQLFPGEEDLPLTANIDFGNVIDKTQEGWEKCISTIQYDNDTKQLWEELQKPYGNQSSFLRHLILLEKYFRNGDLVLSPNASHHATNYSESVQNRLRAYDNIPSHAVHMQPLSMMPFNKRLPTQNVANIPKNIPISITQLGPNVVATVRPKPANAPPPGLISLQQSGNSKSSILQSSSSSQPVPPAMKQKLKVAVSKNSWRPTLIPITQSQQHQDGGKKRVSGLVQVISGGKPYHITMQDYNRMCAIRRNQQMKMARGSDSLGMRTTQAGASGLVTSPSSAASLLKPGLMVARKLPSETTCTKNDSTSGSSPADNPTKLLPLPRIPKSLTVIPQTVPRKTQSPNNSNRVT